MPRTKASKHARPKISVILDRSLIEQVDEFRLKRQDPLTRSAVVETALKSFFDEDSDYHTLYRALNRVRDQVTNLDDRQATLSEAFLLFVQVFLYSTPTLEDTHLDQLKKLMPGRFSKYLKTLANHLERGGVMLTQLQEAGIPGAALEQDDTT